MEIGRDEERRPLYFLSGVWRIMLKHLYYSHGSYIKQICWIRNNDGIIASMYIYM
jgi:hypothetical protein